MIPSLATKPIPQSHCLVLRRPEFGQRRHRDVHSRRRQIRGLSTRSCFRPASAPGSRCRGWHCCVAPPFRGAEVELKPSVRARPSEISCRRRAPVRRPRCCSFTSLAAVAASMAANRPRIQSLWAKSFYGSDNRSRKKRLGTSNRPRSARVCAAAGKKGALPGTSQSDHVLKSVVVSTSTERFAGW
jgi:hypothetical protein